MEDKMRLTKKSHHQKRSESGDDDCSTDSGCSSGGSTESADGLSRACGKERSSSHNRGYLRGLRINDISTRSQERLSRSSIDNHSGRSNNKSSRSWSPSDSRRNLRESPSHSSSSPPDEQSTDSDSFKRASKADILSRALRCLKIGMWDNNGREKKLTKKSPKRILREPVSYTYIRGLSGLPTQRVPRTLVNQCNIPCPCQDIRLYRKNPDRR